MPSYTTPKRATEFIFYVSLRSQANTKIAQVNPTLAAGDVKVSIDGGAEANLTTLPTVTPAGGKGVKVTVSAAEMTADNARIIFSDAAGSEWCDLTINIQTTARQIDDLLYPTVSGRSLDVSIGGEAGLDWANVGSPTTVVVLSGTTVAWNSAWDAEVQSEVVDGLNQYGAATSAEVAASDDAVLAAIAALNNLSSVGAQAAAAAALTAYGAATIGSAMTLTSGERDAVAVAAFDLVSGVETGLTLRQALRLIAAASAGKLSGAATTTIVIRNAVADSKDRITAVVDASGNRSAITVDLT